MKTNCRLLIVDDEILVRQGIKHLLNWEKEGFIIVGEAGNGQEALQLIDKLVPHIVITDIVMPIVDGVELTTKIKELYPQIEVIVLSSFSEFHYVRDTFQQGVADYILKPRLDAQYLLSIVQRTAKKIPALSNMDEAVNEQTDPIYNLLDRLMSGYEDSPEIEEQISSIMPFPSFRLFGVDLKYLQTEHMTREQIIYRIKEMLEPFMNSLFYVILPTNNQSIIFLLNSYEQQWAMVKPAIRALTNSSRFGDYSLLWIFDRSFPSVNQLFEIYNDSYLKLISYRFFLPEHTKLIMADELPRLTERSIIFNLNSYMELLYKRKFEAANEQLITYMEAAIHDYRLDSFEFKSQLGNIIFNMLIVLNKLEYQVKELEVGKYQHIKKINESKHVTEAVAEMNIFIGELNSVIASNRFMSSNPNLSLILDYLHEHYMEPISLSDVAQHFHFNPSYLSTFFSSHNEEGFSEYLNRIRVEKASELLANTDLAISDISVQVGYADHSYFTKVFKKLKGASPSHYRKLNVGKIKGKEA